MDFNFDDNVMPFKINIENNTTDLWLESIFNQISVSQEANFSSRPIYIVVDPNATIIDPLLVPSLVSLFKDQIKRGRQFFYVLKLYESDLK